jgi:hypothetical protein
VAFVWTVDVNVSGLVLWSLNDVVLVARLVEQRSHRFVHAIV